MRRAWMRWLAASLATLWAQTGASAPPATKREGPCTKGYQEAREHVEAGRFRRARELLAACAKPSCGGVAQQCQAALNRLDIEAPSIIPVPMDRAGVPLVDVVVRIDGEPLTSRIDGRSVLVDPGLHEISGTTAHGEVRTERLLVVQGQRNRVVELKLDGAASAASDKAFSAVPAAVPPSSPELPKGQDEARVLPVASTNATTSPAAPSPAEPSSSPPVLAYVVGGVGLAAVGGSFLLAHWGREDNLLLDRCAPNCSQDSVDHVSNMYLAADITLGVGVVALGAATWLYFSNSGNEKPSTEQAYRFDVQPTRSGAIGTFGSAF